MSEQNSQNFQQTKWFLSGGVSGEVLSPGGDHISGLQGDHGTVGVGDKAGSQRVAVHTDGVDRAASSGVGNLGRVHSGLISRDDSAVSVGNQSARHGVAKVGVDRVRVETQVSGASSSNLGSVGGHLGAVGVGHQGSGGGYGHAGSKNLEDEI